MSFALLHATLGWAFAALAALALRRRSADARCWAWRLGLLKGPLALLLAVPVVVNVPPLPFGGEGPGVRGTLAPDPRATGRGGGPVPPPLVPLSTPEWKDEGTGTLPLRRGQATAESPGPVPPTLLSPNSLSPNHPFLLPYLAGLLVVLAHRLAPRRVHREMPRVEGTLRPRVVIPDGLDPESAVMARAHEEAHVRRRDPLWSLVADLVCAALWFAPPVWLCARALRAEAEAACDADTLATGVPRGAYARLLLAHAGPAPANALGGPARRLARRILMLERNAKPLSRSLAGALLVLGLVALLPWRAVAQAPTPTITRGPLRSAAFRWVQATRIPLDRAAGLMLDEPGVKARVGWTPADDAKVEAAQARWEAVVNVYRAEMGARQKAGPLRDFYAWDEKARPAAFARADKAAGFPIRTPEQDRVLKALALARFGSAVWKDPEVASRLRLTPAQVAAVTRENAAIVKAYRAAAGDMRGELLRPTPKMPPAVRKRMQELNAALAAAPPAKRQPFYLKIANLQAPYQPVFKSAKPEEYRDRHDRAVAESWAMRAAADRRLESALTGVQRKALWALKSNPEAWNAPVEVARADGLSFNGQNADRLPAPKRSGDPVKVVRAKDGAVLKVYRDGTKSPYTYRIDRVPPASNADAPHLPASKNAISTHSGPGVTASIVKVELGRYYFSEDLAIDGRPAAALPDPVVSGDPIKVVVGKDGTGWRFYRKSSESGLYRYEGERITQLQDAATGRTLVGPHYRRPASRR